MKRKRIQLLVTGVKSEQNLEQRVPCAKGSKQCHWEQPPVISSIPHLSLLFSLSLSHVVVLIGILLIPFHVVPVNKGLYPLLQISRLQKDETSFSGRGICSLLRAQWFLDSFPNIVTLRAILILLILYAILRLEGKNKAISVKNVN